MKILINPWSTSRSFGEVVGGRTLRVVCDEVVREHMIDENAGRRRVRHSKFEQGKV